MKQVDKYKVCTQCMTYNQAPFIEDTLHGFAIQETTFPVVYCVIDDASTDGEQEVLRKWANKNLCITEFNDCCRKLDYGELIEAPLKEKPNLFFVFLLLKENHWGWKPKYPYIIDWLSKAQYHAICEGDDYWTDPQKLQMQTDFMDSHPDYSLCHTDFNLTQGERTHYSTSADDDGNWFPRIFFDNLQIGTLTILYRRSFYDKTPKLYTGKKWGMSDYPMYIELSREGKIKYFPQITANYRICPESASHGTLEKEIAFVESGRKVTLFYADYYGVEVPKEVPSYYMKIMKSCFKHRNKDVAKDYKNKAKEKGMTSRKMWIFYYATICPVIGFIVRKLRKPL